MAIAVVAGLAVVGTYYAYEAKEDAKDAAKAQKEANRVSTAQQKVTDIEARRQKVREARVRRAKVEQTSSNLGTQGSSGEIGALGALETLTNTSIAQSTGAQKTAGTVSNLQQQAADSNISSQENQFLSNTSFQLAAFAAPKPKPTKG